jgi:hypothetical protein
MKRDAKTGKRFDKNKPKYDDEGWKVEPTPYEKAFAEMVRRRNAGENVGLAIVGWKLTVL